MNMYDVYPIKFDFARGSGTENHEFYYFINCTHDFWMFIKLIWNFMILKFYHVLIVLIQNYDHVVVGTGPAGITLALQLKKKNKNRVLLVEAGSFENEEDSQEFYKGAIINNCNLKELHESRIRAFGGTSMVWGGMCRELDEIDFDEWPIKKTDLSIYLEEAKNILDILSLC